jgi:hypothetical protein
MNDVFGGDQYASVEIGPPFAFVFLIFGLSGDYVGTRIDPHGSCASILQICVGNGQVGQQGSNHKEERHGKVSEMCLSDIWHL